MDEYKRLLRKIYFSIFLIVTVYLIGSVGFKIIEDWNFLDSFYFTAITLSTVGYGIPGNGELTTEGKIFASILIVTSISIVLYAFSNLTAFFVEGEVKKYLEVRKMLKRIAQLKNHYIVVGAGRTSRFVLNEFMTNDAPFVVIDKDEQAIKELMIKLKHEDMLYIVGDAKNEEILLQAGLMEASWILLTSSNDVDNLYIVLTSKTLNPLIKIIARASDIEAMRKLMYAGCDYVILPHEISGLRMASVVLRPHVVSFLDIITRTEGKTLEIGEIEIPRDSWMVGKSLSELRISNKFDIIVISIKNKSGRITFNPKGNTIIEEGDVLIVLGEESKIRQLRESTKEEVEKT